MQVYGFLQHPAMERVHILALAFAALLSAFTAAHAPAPAPARSPADADFIRSACGYTRYPAVCEQYLAGYNATALQSYRDLAVAALHVTLTVAQSNSTYISALSSGDNAVSDCAHAVDDTVDLVEQALGELGRMGRPESPSYAWYLSNVQTWVSNAIEQLTGCLDGLSGDRQADPSTISEVRDKVLSLAQGTSNALTLINLIRAKK